MLAEFRAYSRRLLALCALAAAALVAAALPFCLSAHPEVAAGLAAGAALGLGRLRLRAWRLERFARLAGGEGVKYLVGARLVDYGLLALGLLAAALAGAELFALAGGLLFVNLVMILNGAREARRAAHGG